MKERSATSDFTADALSGIRSGRQRKNDDILKTFSNIRSEASVENIQNLAKEDVMRLQHILQHGDRFGYWVTPKKWQATSRCEAVSNVDIRRRIINFLSADQQKIVLRSYQCLEGAPSAPLKDGVESWPNYAHVRAIIDGAILTITRYLVLLRMGPVGLGRKVGLNGSLDPGNVQQIAYSFCPRFIALAVSKLLPEATLAKRAHGITGISLIHIQKYFASINTADLSVLGSAFKCRTDVEIRRMRKLETLGLWTDVPDLSGSLMAVTSVAGPAQPIAAEKVTGKHMPLPDLYVSEMGVRSLWFIEELAPNLLKIAKHIIAIWDRTENLALRPAQVESRRRYILRKYLNEFTWRDSVGKTISAPPFQLRLAKTGKNKSSARQLASTPLLKMTPAIDDFDDDDMIGDESVAVGAVVDWPPRSYTEVAGLLGNLQLAHLFVSSLSTGARKSETLSMTRDCVVQAPNGLTYANARTFKLVERHDGVLRDWILPDIATQAIEQQIRLVELAEKIGKQRPQRLHVDLPAAAATATAPNHLWAQLSGQALSDCTAPLTGLGQALSSYAKSLGMDLNPGGQKLRKHRLRKTVARLVALALTQGPKVLMDVFGHKAIEMTLYYILTDKDLAAEIETVCRELRIMRAKEAIEKMVEDERATDEGPSLGGFGGPAALVMRRAIDTEKGRLHQRGEERGANSAFELAEILTLQGNAWLYVRPGVICTKFLGTESGPCNKSKGHPEPSRCETGCKHRLEEEFLREDVDGSIRDSVKAYLECGANRDELVQAHWAGQVRAHVGRFADLRAKWMSNETVKAIFEELGTVELYVE